MAGDPRILWLAVIGGAVLLILFVGCQARSRLARRRRALVALLERDGILPRTALYSHDGLAAAAVDWRDHRLVLAAAELGEPRSVVLRAWQVRGARILIDGCVVAGVERRQALGAGRRIVGTHPLRGPAVADERVQTLSTMVLRILGETGGRETILDLHLLMVGEVEPKPGHARRRFEEASRFLARVETLLGDARRDGSGLTAQGGAAR